MNITDKRIIDDITQLTKNGYSDAYIEAQIYGKYSRTHSISKIGELMNHIKIRRCQIAFLITVRVYEKVCLYKFSN